MTVNSRDLQTKDEQWDLGVLVPSSLKVAWSSTNGIQYACLPNALRHRVLESIHCVVAVQNIGLNRLGVLCIVPVTTQHEECNSNRVQNKFIRILPRTVHCGYNEGEQIASLFLLQYRSQEVTEQRSVKLRGIGRIVIIFFSGQWNLKREITGLRQEGII